MKYELTYSGTLNMFRLTIDDGQHIRILIGADREELFKLAKQ